MHSEPDLINDLNECDSGTNWGGGGVAGRCGATTGKCIDVSLRSRRRRGRRNLGQDCRSGSGTLSNHGPLTFRNPRRRPPVASRAARRSGNQARPQNHSGGEGSCNGSCSKTTWRTPPIAIEFGTIMGPQRRPGATYASVPLRAVLYGTPTAASQTGHSGCRTTKSPPPRASRA